MKVKIDKDILNKFPSLNMGIVVAKGVDNTGSDEKIYELLEEVEKLIQMNFVSEKLAENEMISPWRAAYSEFGAKPSKYHNSVESLMRTVLKGKKIPKISKLVDLYNYLSLKHLVPMGADDLSKIEGDIKLKFAKGKEKFTPLGKTEKEEVDKGEVIYSDDKKVLCRKWNWRECDQSKITKDTQDVIIYIEGLFPVTKEKIIEVCKETVDLVQSFCGGKATYQILNNELDNVKL